MVLPLNLVCTTELLSETLPLMQFFKFWFPGHAYDGTQRSFSAESRTARNDDQNRSRPPACESKTLELRVLPFATNPATVALATHNAVAADTEWCGFHGSYISCSQSSESCLTRSGVEYGADTERHFSPRPGA